MRGDNAVPADQFSRDEPSDLTNGTDNVKGEEFEGSVFEEEQNRIRIWRANNGRRAESYFRGIALSGGGIRSAVFSIGALQALAGKGFLERFDYLSTVSGGGYTGASLVWWLGNQAEAEEKFDLGEKFPYGTQDPSKAVPKELRDKSGELVLNHLRRHGNYLTPGNGITIWSGIAIVLRAIFLNLVVWIPLTAATILVTFLIGALAENASFGGGNIACKLLDGFVESLKLQDAATPQNQGCASPFIFLTALALGALLVCVFLAFSLIYSPASAFVAKYRLRRFFEIWAGKAIASAFLLAAFGSLPLIYGALDATLGGAEGGTISLITGIVMALAAHFRSASRLLPGPVMRYLLPVASALFIYGIGLLGYALAILVINYSNLHPEQSGELGLLFICIVLAVIAFGFFTNSNYISLHRFYRDRLMEAFLPDWETVFDEVGDRKGAPAATKADVLALHEAWDVNFRCPFPIINTNVILTNSEHENYRLWGGDSFALTPFMSGSDATKWCMTKDLADGTVTLPSAMAISGAAVNPAAGPGGSGLTRNRMVALVMTFLNFRLGYWVPTPLQKRGRLVPKKPNHFMPNFIYSIPGHGHCECSSYLELSDGGHFDNLGVYELLRRKLRLITVCDGEADKETAYSSFVTLIRRAEERFGVTFEFEHELGPARLIRNEEPGRYPSNATFAKAGHFVARINYEGGETGVLIYMKTTLVTDLTMKALSYAGANPHFPDQSTADQFFDEEQFEAYRELGYRIALDMFKDVRPDRMLECLERSRTSGEIVQRYWDNASKKHGAA